MRYLLWLPVLALLSISPDDAVMGATVIGRDDARQCYFATLSDLDAANYRQRLADCDRAIAAAMDDSYRRAGLLVNRSDIKLKMQDYQGALADADASIALQPELAAAYLNRGAGLIGLKQYRQAIPALEKAIMLGDGEKLQIAYFNRGLAHDYLGDLKDAYFDYKRASEIDPNFEPAKTQLRRFTVTTAP